MSKSNRIKREQKLAAPPPPPKRTVTRMNRIIVCVVLALTVAGGVAAFALRGGGGNPRESASAGIRGLQTGSAPWAPGEIGLTDRLKKTGVPFSNMQGTALHIHPQLAIVVDGQPMPVAANIGISPADQAMAALHTHDDSGTIHVESPVARTYNLGEFFDVWGVRLTRTCLGGYCANPTKHVAAFVDGSPFRGNPRNITFKDGERIILAYGTKAEVAQAMP